MSRPSVWLPMMVLVRTLDRLIYARSTATTEVSGGLTGAFCSCSAVSCCSCDLSETTTNNDDSRTYACRSDVVPNPLNWHWPDDRGDSLGCEYHVHRAEQTAAAAATLCCCV